MTTPEMMYMSDGQATAQKEDFIDKIRKFVKNQKRTRGYKFTMAVGENTYDIKISGTAKVLLGFAFVPEVMGDTIKASSMKLTINNEVIVDSVNPNFFGPEFTEEGYYFFPRPLNGSDTVEVVLTGEGSPSTCYFVIYYV